MQSYLQFTGVGLRTPHYQTILEKRPPVAWLEVHSENYFVDDSKPLQLLKRIRENYPISLHGVGMSLGSIDELNWQHLKKLKNLIERIEPCLISDHLSWSAFNGHYFHDLLPLPLTQEMLQHLIAKINEVQEFLQRTILIENISSYVRFKENEMHELEFLKSVAQQSGCGILLDINNIYVNAINFNEDPYSYLSLLPGHLIQEIHLAGFEISNIDHEEVLIDTHNRSVVPAVWDLYTYAIKQFGPKPTIIEWDKDIPSFETLYLEAYRAEKIIREYYVNSKRAS